MQFRQRDGGQKHWNVIANEIYQQTMKLSRRQLIRAKDVQLHAIGLRRKQNSGWLQSAVRMDFTAEQVAAFEGSKAMKPSLLKSLNPSTALDFETKRADNLAENCRWLVERFDEIHAVLCPGRNGTWQMRVQQCVNAANKLTKPKEELFHIETTRDDHKPMNAHPKRPEDFANELYEQSGRDLA